MKAFLLPRRGAAQDLRRIFFQFFPVHTLSTEDSWVIRIQARFSTALCTGHPQVTGCHPQEHWVVGMSAPADFQWLSLFNFLVFFLVFADVIAVIIRRNPGRLFLVDRIRATMRMTVEGRHYCRS